MRVLIIALLLMPLSGCIGGIGLLESDLFDYIEVERGDPTPVALDDCSGLLDALNLRAQQQALVSLHQSYENAYYRHSFGGGGDVAMEESVSDGAASPAAAPQDNGAKANLEGAEVTGTNNQEQNVDEADIIKTDGTWTYVAQGSYLYIMKSNSVGNLTLHSTIQLAGGWATQLLLVNQGTEDKSDDRLVVIMNGVVGPDDETEKSDGDQTQPAEDSIASSSYYYYGGSYSLVQVLALGDRSEPAVLSQHYVQGNLVGARLVDGIVYTVVYQYSPHLDLINWAGPDEALLKEEGLTWDEYYRLPVPEQKEINLKAVEKAIVHNDEVLAQATLEDHLPHIYNGAGAADVEPYQYTEAACRHVLTTLDDMGRSVSTILSIDAEGNANAFEAKQILGGYPLLYGAEDALVLASSSQEFWWFWAQPDLDEATNLHWFDLDGLEVSHRASGRVEGIVQDQFGIDVHDDQLRIVTTTGTWGRWWLEDPAPMMNHLFVFDEVEGLLVPTGSVTGFAEEERVWSVRFTDERAYVVTFEQIDPLWIIDLTDTSNPTILGELEIPGVSTYLHPLPGENAILSIGLGPRIQGDEESGLDWSRIQVSLFDISDPTNPVRADVYDVTLPEGGEKEGYSWGYSAALNEHKAFTYWDKLGMLAIPVTWQHYEYNCETEGSTRTCTETNEFHTGLDLINVDVEAGTLTQYGEVDQDHMMSNDGYYWGAEVQRSYFLGFPDEYPSKPVSVYALSSIGMSAHDLQSLSNQDSVRFQADEGNYNHCRGQEVICAVDSVATLA